MDDRLKESSLFIVIPRRIAKRVILYTAHRHVYLEIGSVGLLLEKEPHPYVFIDGHFGFLWSSDIELCDLTV